MSRRVLEPGQSAVLDVPRSEVPPFSSAGAEAAWAAHKAELDMLGWVDCTCWLLPGDRYRYVFQAFSIEQQEAVR